MKYYFIVIMKKLKLVSSNHVITAVFTSEKDYFLNLIQCRVYLQGYVVLAKKSITT